MISFENKFRRLTNYLTGRCDINSISNCITNLVIVKILCCLVIIEFYFIIIEFLSTIENAFGVWQAESDYQKKKKKKRIVL